MSQNWTPEQLAEHNRRHPGHRPYPEPAIAAPPKAKGAPREPRGMNKTERAYSAHLDLEKRIGAIRWWRYEGMTLRLADDCRFTADFLVMMADGRYELHDCKVLHRGATRAHIEDDALVKLRTAAEQFEITVKVVWPTPNGEWDYREF